VPDLAVRVVGSTAGEGGHGPIQPASALRVEPQGIGVPATLIGQMRDWPFSGRSGSVGNVLVHEDEQTRLLCVLLIRSN
jgi:hypothetical protein